MSDEIVDSVFLVIFYLVFFCILQALGGYIAILVAFIEMPPAVLADNSAVIRPPFERTHKTRVGSRIIPDENLAAEDPDPRDSCGVISSGDARHTDAVIADGGDSSCHMRAVGISDNPGTIVHEVIAAVFPCGDAVSREIRVVQVHPAIHNGHYHLAAADGVVFPDLLNVDAGALVRRVHCLAFHDGHVDGQVVVEIPLPFEIRVIGEAHALDLARGADLLHTIHGTERVACLDDGSGTVVPDDIPPVEAVPAGTRLEFAGIRVETLVGNYAEVVDGSVETLGFSIYLICLNRPFQDFHKRIVHLYDDAFYYFIRLIFYGRRGLEVGDLAELNFGASGSCRKNQQRNQYLISH